MIRSRQYIGACHRSPAVDKEFQELKHAIRFPRTAKLAEDLFEKAEKVYQEGRNRLRLDGWILESHYPYGARVENTFAVYWGFDVEGRTLIAEPTWARLSGVYKEPPPIPLKEIQLGKFTQDLVIIPQPNWLWNLHNMPKTPKGYQLPVLAFQNEAEHQISLYDAILCKALE